MEQHFYIKWMRKEERIMRIAFLTLGCKVNSYETDKMKNKFIEAGLYRFFRGRGGYLFGEYMYRNKYC